MELPSNSQNPKPPSQPEKTEDKKVEKVVTGEVSRKRKPLGQRFLETFFGGDAKSVGKYVVLEVIIPAAKDLVVDAGFEALQRMVHGDSRPSGRRSGYRPGSTPNTTYTNYSRTSPFSSQSNMMRREEPRTMSQRARGTHNFDEILLPSRIEAEEVLGNMISLLERYEQVSVSDLYNLTGITPSYTDEKWGWTTLQGARVIRDRSGKYLLDLPSTEQLAN